MRRPTRLSSGGGGYTLLEVMLFLAISSALALIAFTGLGPRLRNTRFTDATRSLQSDIVREISNTEVGVNRRANGSCQKGLVAGKEAPVFTSAGSEAGTSAGCVVNGRLVELTKDEAVYYSIISLRTADVPEDCQQDDIATIVDCFKPRILTSDEDKPIKKAHKSGMQVDPVVRFGYVQNPNSTSKHYFFYDPNLTFTDAKNQLLAIGSSGTVLGGTPNQCATLSLSGRKASLTFTTTSPQPELNSKGCTT